MEVVKKCKSPKEASFFSPSSSERKKTTESSAVDDQDEFVRVNVRSCVRRIRTLSSFCSAVLALAIKCLTFSKTESHITVVVLFCIPGSIKRTFLYN